MCVCMCARAGVRAHGLQDDRRPSRGARVRYAGGRCACARVPQACRAGGGACVRVAWPCGPAPCALCRGPLTRFVMVSGCGGRYVLRTVRCPELRDQVLGAFRVAAEPVRDKKGMAVFRERRRGSIRLRRKGPLLSRCAQLVRQVRQCSSGAAAGTRTAGHLPLLRAPPGAQQPRACLVGAGGRAASCFILRCNPACAVAQARHCVLLLCKVLAERRPPPRPTPPPVSAPRVRASYPAPPAARPACVPSLSVLSTGVICLPSRRAALARAVKICSGRLRVPFRHSSPDRAPDRPARLWRTQRKT